MNNIETGRIRPVQCYVDEISKEREMIICKNIRGVLLKINELM